MKSCIDLAHLTESYNFETLCIKPQEKFRDVPIRYSDILHNRWLKASLLVCFTLQEQDTILWGMTLSEQLSPPHILMMGTYKWSILHFVVCSLNCNVISYSFHVNVADVDVGREGPFSVVQLNSQNSIAACFSSRHCYYVVFPMPTTSPITQPISSSTFLLPSSPVTSKWHPFINTLLVILTTKHIVLLDLTVPQQQSCQTLDGPFVDFLFVPSSCCKNLSSFDFNLIMLKQDGSIYHMTLHRNTMTFIKPNDSFATNMDFVEKNFITEKNTKPFYLTFFQPPLVEPALSSCDKPCATLFFSSLVLLSYDPILVLARLSEKGEIHVFGIDLCLDALEDCSIKTTQKDVSSYLLESFCIPFQSSMPPSIDFHPLCSTQKDFSFSHSCPYFLLVTPQQVVLVEFPWLKQIYSFSHRLHSSPFLLPTNITQISGISMPSCTEDQNHLYHLGFHLNKHTTHTKSSPSYILLVATIQKNSTQQSLTYQSMEWEVCEKWRIKIQSLEKYLTTNFMIDKYQNLVNTAWSLLASTSYVSLLPIKSKGLQILTDSHAVLTQSVKTLVEKHFEDMNKPSPTIQPIYPNEPVKDVLGKLGTASIFLWKIKSFKQYLCQLHESLLKTNITARLQTLQRQITLIQKTYETLLHRIQKILKDHKNNTEKFQYLLQTYTIPLQQKHTQLLILEDILPIIKRFSLPATFLLTNAIKKNQQPELFSKKKNCFVLDHEKSRGQTAFYDSLQTNILFQHAEKMSIELKQTCLAFHTLIAQAEHVFKKNIPIKL